MILLLYITDINSESSNMQEFLEFLKGVTKLKKKHKRKSWFQRKQDIMSNWESIRGTVWNSMKARETMTETCNVCSERNASIVCQHCQQHSLCFLCDVAIHSSSPFHDRMIDGTKLLPLQSLDPEEGIVFNG